MLIWLEQKFGVGSDCSGSEVVCGFIILVVTILLTWSLIPRINRLHLF